MILVIGVGNPLRRDDGAGHVAAERLAQTLRALGHEVRLLQTQQLAPELAIDISHDLVRAVLFVDAGIGVEAPLLERLAGPDGGDVYGSVSADSPQGFTHTLGPATLLAYATLLRTPPPPAWIVRLPAIDFGHGEGLSDHALAAMQGLRELAFAFCAALDDH